MYHSRYTSCPYPCRNMYHTDSTYYNNNYRASYNSSYMLPRYLFRAEFSGFKHLLRNTEEIEYTANGRKTNSHGKDNSYNLSYYSAGLCCLRILFSLLLAALAIRCLRSSLYASAALFHVACFPSSFHPLQMIFSEILINRYILYYFLKSYKTKRQIFSKFKNC